MPKDPSCDLCGDNGPLMLNSKCHGTAPLRMELEGNILTARCYIPECNRVVTRFQVAAAAPIVGDGGPAVVAYLRGAARPELGPIEVGDLVIVELPANCGLITFPGYDFAQTLRVMDVARRIGQHVRDQGGVNASLLEELAKATEAR